MIYKPSYQVRKTKSISFVINHLVLNIIMINLSISCPNFATKICTLTGDWLANHYLIAWFLVLGFIIWGIASRLLDVIPQLQKIKAEIMIPWAKKREHGRRVKSAIKADIEGRINTAILAMGNKLPNGWINKMKIEWVENESKDDFFADGEMVLRIRPLEDQTKNLVRAGYAFLQKAFFPRASNVVPKEHREASVLFTGRKIMIQQGGKIKEAYEDIILEPAVHRNKRVLPIMKHYQALDERGFFMGSFLREVNAVAIGAQFDSVSRNKMREEASALIDHMEDFIAHYPQRIPEILWSRQGPITNYGFILVAKPLNVETNNIRIFVNRAQERLAKGVDRLYIFGVEDSRSFTWKVVDAIARQVPEYEIIERFDLTNDYRGQPGGFGALLARRKQG